ncbi:MAG: nascent polypeptide-associated complex protein [Candidatus Norongarragalinales archaeon]
MFPKMDAKQMAKLMQQMGLRTEEVDAERVVIEKRDGSRIVIENPSVTLIDAKGLKSFQISGDVKEEAAQEAAALKEKEESDVDVIARQAGVSRDEAEKALLESDGDIAEAILALEEKKKR